MGTVMPEIGAELAAWIEAQPMFFVATAPSGDDGHVNLSPKGARRSFAIFGAHEVGYVDLFGSGIETVAHLKQNGRIVLMFCAFEGSPKVVRLHGRGEVIEQGDERFASMLERFDLEAEAMTSVRSIVFVHVTRIADSCGFVVPEMTLKRERDALFRTAAAWIRQDGPGAIDAYCAINNASSIDGLPGLDLHDGDISDNHRARRSHQGKKL